MTTEPRRRLHGARSRSGSRTGSGTGSRTGSRTAARTGLGLGAHAALDAAAIADPALRASYLRCRALHARYGRTYFLATLLLPPARRPYVWALYGFARYADEIVDDVSGPIGERAARFEAWSAARLAEFERGHSADEIGRAAVHTAQTWGIPVGHTAAFLTAMRADLTVDSYATFEDLLTYMHGSAAVIGLQMLPLLRPADPRAAAEPARALGIAFQLTNFIRDVGEDLDRGRLYLPTEDLEAFGVTRGDLEERRITRPIRDLMAYQVDRARRWYACAAPGLEMLHPDSRPCIEAATRLYGGILDEVERAGYRVLDRRVRVPLRTRLRVGLSARSQAGRAWRAPSHDHQPSVHSARANPNSRSSTGA